MWRAISRASKEALLSHVSLSTSSSFVSLSDRIGNTARRLARSYHRFANHAHPVSPARSLCNGPGDIEVAFVGELGNLILSCPSANRQLKSLSSAVSPLGTPAALLHHPHFPASAVILRLSLPNPAGKVSQKKENGLFHIVAAAGF